MMPRMRATIGAAVLAMACSVLLADYDVRVELKNLSGEVKNNWPVVLRVYTVLGRNLPAGSVQPDGFHIYDPYGKEVPHWIEVVPPDDQPGNDEIIFTVPSMAPGEAITYRITNTAEKTVLRREIDIVNGPHNLIANGDFERPGETSLAPDGFAGAGQQDAQVRRTGRASLRLSADGQTVAARVAKPIALHKGSWYYFGVWSKTDNVSRFGYQAGDAASFGVTGFSPPATTQPPHPRYPEIPNQCYTRDWLKVTFEYRGHTGWGMDLYAAPAVQDTAQVEFVLDQRKHYYMEPGKTHGAWWLDGAVLLEQPEVNVRFDLAVQKQTRDGVFLFTRPNNSYAGRIIIPPERWRGEENNYNDPQPWCNFPYAHEALTRLDKWAMRGQRVTYCIGLYHTRELGPVSCSLRENDLRNAEQQSIEPELIEYCPGCTGDDRERYLDVLYEEPPAGQLRPKVQPVRPTGEQGVRLFFLTFRVPRTFHVPLTARTATYTAMVQIREGDALLAEAPITLRVQDLEQPIIKDTYVGLIHQSGSPVPASDEMLKVYGRSGFTSITWFGYFVPYRRGDDGRMHVDADGLVRQVRRVKAADITAGCGIYSDVQLDDKPRGHQGYMIRFARQEVAAALAATQAAASRPGATGPPVPTEKEAYARLLKELDAIWKEHPDWPALIHMNWDEPPPVNEKMGWTREILPDALVTLDTQFNPLAAVAKYYNMPAFDNPADWSGPELYRWVKQASGDFGYCGQPASAEWSRYQGGMLMITTGARYFHGWHLENANAQIHAGPTKGSVVRAISLIAWADALNDLKCHRLLVQAVGEAKKSGDPVRVAAAAEAEEYLRKVFATWNGDHKKRWPIEPVLGQAADWGYEQFYDDWQEQMAKHAAAVLGVKWVD